MHGGVIPSAGIRVSTQVPSGNDAVLSLVERCTELHYRSVFPLLVSTGQALTSTGPVRCPTRDGNSSCFCRGCGYFRLQVPASNTMF
jgi:hypothetical protein